MINPYVTVLISVYNGEKYLADSIQSILDQSYRNFELLIIDDGSTDRTVNIIESYNDERLRLLKNVKNRGLPFTRNLAMKEAKGLFLALLDADDIALPNRLEMQVNFLVNNPEVAMCGSHGVFINDKGELTGQYRVPIDPEEIKVRLAFQNVFLNSTRMYRLDALRNTDGYYNGLCEDYEMAVQLNPYFLLSNLDEVLVKYRIHDNNISSVFAEKMEIAEKYIVGRIHKQLGIEENWNLITMHHSLKMGSLKENFYTIDEYKTLFIILKEANFQQGIYPNPYFNKMLFSFWYQKIREKGNKKSMILFFSKPLFAWDFVTLKMLRKMFKQTFGIK